MAGNNPGREPVNVVLPGEPPALTTGAAQALLRILVKVWEEQEGIHVRHLEHRKHLTARRKLHRRLRVTSAPEYGACRAATGRGA
jgi:hypothetical protein